MDLDQIRHDYQKALRAWHFAWTEREIAHRDHFQPIALRDHGLVYDMVLRELELRRRSRSERTTASFRHGTCWPRRSGPKQRAADARRGAPAGAGAGAPGVARRVETPGAAITLFRHRGPRRHMAGTRSFVAQMRLLGGGGAFEGSSVEALYIA